MNLGGRFDAEREAFADEATDQFNRIMLNWAHSRDNEFTPEELLEKVQDTKDRVSKLYSQENTRQSLIEAGNSILGQHAKEMEVPPRDAIFFAKNPNDEGAQLHMLTQHGSEAAEMFTPNKPIPPNHIDFLRENRNDEEVRSIFDLEYGIGWSDFILDNSE